MKSSVILFTAAGVAASAFGAGLTSQSYVQDGLIAQFDAIENVGAGQAHDATATVWRDLKGSASLTLQSGAAWAERALDLSTIGHTIANMPAFSTDSCSTEVAMNLVQGKPEGWRRILTVNHDMEGAYNIYFEKGTDSVSLFIRSNGTRPSFGTLTWGTLGVACATNSCYTYRNAQGYGSSHYTGTLGKSAGYYLVPSCGWTVQGYGGGVIHGQYCAFRHYSRPLAQDELALNGLIDRLRFFSFALRGSGETAAWAEVAWAKPVQATATAPAAGFTDYVTIANATVSVGAADTIELAGLSVEDGAVLSIAEGGAVTVRELFAEGVRMSRGIYTATGANGTTAAAWVTGEGEVRVTGSYATRLPKPVAGIGPLSYVQDGLIAQFDAIDNEGTGDHNAAAATWQDLAGTAWVELSGNAKWIDRALDTGASQQTVTNMPNFYYDSVFTEVAVNILSHESGYPRLFYHTGGDGHYNVFHQNSATDEMHFYMGGQSTSRPTVYFSNGTLELGSDRTNIRTYSNGTLGGTSGSYALGHGTPGAASWYLDKDGKLHSHFKSFRHYNRALTKAEIDHNRQIDIFRFESYLYTGDGSAVDWSAIAWKKPEKGGTGDAPSAATNEYAVIANAAVQVGTASKAAFKGLSLERGATFAVAEGAKVDVKRLYVNGSEVARGVYTATGANGTTAAAWVTGAGEVRVAGGFDRGVPSIPVVGADGWYTYGLIDGKNERSWIIGERVNFDDYIFPEGAKLRLRGYVLFDTAPDCFAEYDTTELKCAYVNATRPYAVERPFVVPQGAVFRFVPGTWTTYANSSNAIPMWAVSQTLMAQTTGDVVLGKNAQFQVSGDGMPNLTYGGLLSGEGNVYIVSYGRQMRFTGGFAVNGSTAGTWQPGTGIWFDTVAMTGSLQSVTLDPCNYQSGTNIDYSTCYLMFGKNASDATADHPLEVGTLSGGNARTKLDEPSGHLWRSGGHILVWGSNTVHVGTLKQGIHAVASQKEQDCTNGFLHKGYYSGKGIGFLAVDEFASGTIYGSTNVALTIGAAAAGTAFDYTCQAGGVNALSLEVTGSCDENTTVRATDLAMLPARIKGFRGAVRLTDSTARAYEIPVDLTAGPKGNCAPVGCDGSGTLAAAPATSTINITFPTEGIDPKPGKYAIARFSAGGALLDGWTVTLNGEDVREVTTGGHTYTLRRTDRGIYLGVDQPGLTVYVK